MNGVAVAFNSVDPATRSGTGTVPAGVYSGTVYVVTNGQRSPESLLFSVPGPVPDCGGIHHLHFTADGGAVVFYDPLPNLPADARCPAPNAAFDPYVAKVSRA